MGSLNKNWILASGVFIVMLSVPLITLYLFWESCSFYAPILAIGFDSIIFGIFQVNTTTYYLEFSRVVRHKTLRDYFGSKPVKFGIFAIVYFPLAALLVLLLCYHFRLALVLFMVIVGVGAVYASYRIIRYFTDCLEDLD